MSDHLSLALETLAPSLAASTRAQLMTQLADSATALADALPRLKIVVALLESMNASDDVIAAAIVHAAGAPRDGLPESWRTLVDGLDADARIREIHAARSDALDPEPLRRLLLAMLDDLRVVPVILAKQLASLRLAIAADDESQEDLAHLTRAIHAPLANRLGIWQLKWELEDLAFRVLEPEAYRRLARSMDGTRRARQAHIELVKTSLQEALRTHGFDAEISGRPKHLYSIWKKMHRKNVALEALQDLSAVRVLVNSVSDCYAVLGLVHATWTPVPGAFDDYIARPKNNDYQSLHTAIIGPEGRIVEVQIRTRDMHAAAELGIAAHWRYKEGGPGDPTLERKVAWMRQLLERGEDEPDQGFGGALASELVEDRVYVLTPKGAVLDLPHGATPLDFAYRVHTDVGHRCIGAKVDGRIVPLDTALATGQRVEIMTGKEIAPRRDWLMPGNRFLASGRSREKVRTWFRKLDRERNVNEGRDIVDRALKRSGFTHADLTALLPEFNVVDLNELFERVALGEASQSAILRALARAAEPPSAETEPSLPKFTELPSRQPNSAQGIRVGGIDNVLTSIAQCCQPVAGEHVAGYFTKMQGLRIHRADCVEFERLAMREPERVVPVAWGDAMPKQAVAITVEAEDRKWLVRDIVNLMSQLGVDVGAINSRALGRSGRLGVEMQVQVRDYGQLALVLDKLSSVAGVEDVRRQSRLAH